jgi:hypothetical protein
VRYFMPTFTSSSNMIREGFASQSITDVPDAAPKLFTALEAAHRNSGLDSSIRQHLIDDLITTLSAFTVFASRDEFPEAGRQRNLLLESTAANTSPEIRRAISKIKDTFGLSKPF